MKDSREFFKVARPFVPVVGRGVKALPSERVRWFSKEWDEPFVSRDMEEEAPFEIDLAQIDREKGSGFWVSRMPESSGSRESREKKFSPIPEEKKSPETEDCHEQETVKEGNFPQIEKEGDNRENSGEEPEV